MIHTVPFICGVILFYTAHFFPLSSLLVFLALIILSFRLNPKLFQTLIVTALAAAGFYHAKSFHIVAPDISDLAGKTAEIRGVPIAGGFSANRGTGSYSYILDINESRPPGLSRFRLFSGAPLDPDTLYDIKARIPKDAGLSNPGDNWNSLAGYAVETDGIGRVKRGLFEKARSRLNAYISDNFSRDSAGFLMSVVTGERGLLTRDMNNAFNVTGLAHILSISGSHFGMLFFVLFSTTVFLVGRLPYRLLVRLTLYVTPSQLAALLCIPAMAGYLGISDMSFPAVRSFIMIILFLFGLLIQRKGAWLNTLLLAAAVIALVRPDSVADLSFQLSFIAVLCIGLTAEAQQNNRTVEQQNSSAAAQQCSGTPEDKHYCSAALDFFRSSLLVSLAATLGAAPLVAHYFHYFSIISPVTNLIITPFIGFVIIPFILASSFIFLVSGWFPLVSLIDKITGLALDSVRYAAGFSFAGIRIPSFPDILLVMFYVGLFCYVILRGRRGKFIPAALAVLPIFVYVASIFFQPKGLHVTYLDVGEGDAAVVELPDNRTMVFDTGTKGFQVGEFLRYRGIDSIDALVLSHGDDDHAGGLTYLMDNFRVSGLWDNGRIIYDRELPGDPEHRVLQRGDVVRGKGYEIAVLHPYEGFYTSGPKGVTNNDSLVACISTGRNSFLFTGDIEREGEEDVSALGGYLKSSVLKVPHHGSRSSAFGPFFAAVSPEIAVISAGRGNPYGHPQRETLEMLGGARIFRTDNSGAIGIRELPDGTFRVRTWKEFRLREAKDAGDEAANLKRLFQTW